MLAPESHELRKGCCLEAVILKTLHLLSPSRVAAEAQIPSFILHRKEQAPSWKMNGDL